MLRIVKPRRRGKDVSMSTQADREAEEGFKKVCAKAAPLLSSLKQALWAHRASSIFFSCTAWRAKSTMIAALPTTERLESPIVIIKNLEELMKVASYRKK